MRRRVVGPLLALMIALPAEARGGDAFHALNLLRPSRPTVAVDFTVPALWRGATPAP